MLKDFTWPRFLGKVVIELLPKLCASVIAGYLLMAQPWKTQAPATSPAAPSIAGSAEGRAEKPAELVAAAHTAPLEMPTVRPAPALEEPEAVRSPPPMPPLRRIPKERQATVAQARVTPAPAATRANASAPTPAPERAVVFAPDRRDAGDESWSDKVLGLGDTAWDATKRGSARVIGVPVAAYEFGRDAVGKATTAVASMLPFTR